jgi:hypothetical protein
MKPIKAWALKTQRGYHVHPTWTKAQIRNNYFPYLPEEVFVRVEVREIPKKGKAKA